MHRNEAKSPAEQPGARPKRSIPSSIAEQLVMWRDFYAQIFGFVGDVESLNPKLPAEVQGFNWLVVVGRGMTLNVVLKELRRKMKVYTYTEDLEDGVPTNERTSEKGDYAVLIRDRIEADEELRNTSANQIEKKGIKTMTLLERLLLELFVFHFTGEHLDMKCYTICAGSRYSDGGVPSVVWYADDDELNIYWCNADDRNDNNAARAESSNKRGLSLFYFAYFSQPNDIFDIS